MAIELAQGQIWQHTALDDEALLICGFSRDGEQVLISGDPEEDAEWWDLDELLAELEDYAFAGNEDDE